MGVVDFVGRGKPSNPPAAIFPLAECGRPAGSFRPRAVDKPPKNGGVFRKRPRVSHESRGLLKNSPPLFSQHGRSALPSPFDCSRKRGRLTPPLSRFDSIQSSGSLKATPGMKERDARRHERNENKAPPSLWALKNALPHFVRAVNRREAWGRAFEDKALLCNGA